jgi:hypothetical protein
MVYLHSLLSRAKKGKSNQFPHGMNSTNTSNGQVNNLVAIFFVVVFLQLTTFAAIVEIIAPNRPIRADVILASIPRPEFDLSVHIISLVYVEV